MNIYLAAVITIMQPIRAVFVSLLCSFLSTQFVSSFEDDDDDDDQPVECLRRSLNMNRSDQAYFPGYKCPLTPQIPEGPFYIPGDAQKSLLNKDPDVIGFPLRLKLKFQNARNCKPVEGLIVHLWNANGAGIVSGYKLNMERFPYRRSPPLNDKRFLRGFQISDKNGEVVFDTVIPRWYNQRAMHINVLANSGCDEPFRSNLFFGDEFQKMIEQYSPYSMAEIPRINNRDDLNYLSYQGDQLLLNPKGNIKDGFYADITFNFAFTSLK